MEGISHIIGYETYERRVIKTPHELQKK